MSEGKTATVDASAVKTFMEARAKELVLAGDTPYLLTICESVHIHYKYFSSLPMLRGFLDYIGIEPKDWNSIDKGALESGARLSASVTYLFGGRANFHAVILDPDGVDDVRRSYGERP